ncbi:FMN-binding negative transcriptional regulator [Marinobacter sp. JSM 1782161]|uniref:FMN-binding negative transcriptional regulator n=1 Tax=Marinobacter sp. JSM 1782161 TaxID=2685906 RepID=UPI0014036C4C|nr:FMN-binding negative transcriptional regulator [Marinobacter sp. JSM 1782161]
MHVPKHFAEQDEQRMRALIRERGFGTLVTSGPEGPVANHLPFHLDDAGHLQCHVAQANPVWQQLQRSPRVLVIFHGPDAYISPNWYATKQETGKAVPTWNYQVIHAHGNAVVVQDRDWLRQHLDRLTHDNESGRPQAWQVDDAPADYIERMTNALVGLEITVDRLEGATKASQNQPERNREGVREGLRREGREAAAAISREVP